MTFLCTQCHHASVLVKVATLPNGTMVYAAHCGTCHAEHEVTMRLTKKSVLTPEQVKMRRNLNDSQKEPVVRTSGLVQGVE